VPMFLSMQLLGGALALALVTILYPTTVRHPQLVDTAQEPP
jgi:hypothetical protein